MQILIVDDTKEIREILAELLTQDGHTVVEAVDGQDGLYKLAQNGVFDLVITDLQMPKLDGYQFAHKAKQMTNAPIVLHTGMPGAELTPDFVGSIPKGDINALKPYLNEWPIDRSCDV